MIMKFHLILGTVLMAALPLTAIAQNDDKPKTTAHAHGEEHVDVPTEAVAVLAPTKGNKVQGVVLMKQMGDSVKLVGKVVGLTPGLHGFHIHQFGDLRDPEGKSAGGHFNPAGAPHAGPDAKERHVGDLGNIEANDQGEATIEMTLKGLKLHYVVGRSLVVHGGEDDLKSQPSGDAGPRVALGVIGFAEMKKKAE